MNVGVIIAAAGSSTRMGGSRSKVLLPLDGRPVLEHSLRLFTDSPAVSRIVIAAREADMAEIRHICLSYAKAEAVAGGADRTASVAAALARLTAEDITHIAVHDGARPLLHPEDWQALLDAAARGEEAVLPAAAVVDTIKQVAPDGRVRNALPRRELAAAQTPQLFAAPLLRRAYAEAADAAVTDDMELVQRLGCRPLVVWTAHENFKLTYEGDLERAARVLIRRRGGPDLLLPGTIRAGQGWDSHRLEPGRPLILGGVDIPFDRGLLGHSDADVLTHAVIDSLLGAAALPDIGRQFPDTDPAYAGVSSLLLLERTRDLLLQAGFRPRQVDATVIAQRPKLAPYIDQMRLNLARCLGLPPSAVSVKAKTAEGLDSVGEGRAMQAQALALVERSDP